VSKEPKKL